MADKSFGPVVNIFYLSTSRIPSATANSVQVMQMCAAFAHLGHAVTLFAKRSRIAEDPYRFYGVEPVFPMRFPPRLKALLPARLVAWRLRRQLAAARPDLIYARNLKALLIVETLGIPLIFEAHSPPRTPELQARLFARPGFRRLVVISSALKEDYLARFPALPEAKVLVAHDGAAIAAPDGPRRLPPSPRLQVGYVGHLYPGRGMDVIAALAVQCPWADFHVVGGQPPELDDWRLRLASVGNVVLHGFVPHRETGAFIGAFDVVLAPYQSRVLVHGGEAETSRWMSPLKIFEYMAHGKPIVASDLPVLGEVLIDRRNALLVAPDAIAAWAEALVRLRDDAPLRRRLGRQARAEFEARYSWPSRARAVLEGLEPPRKSAIVLPPVAHGDRVNAGDA